MLTTKRPALERMSKTHDAYDLATHSLTLVDDAGFKNIESVLIREHTRWVKVPELVTTEMAVSNSTMTITRQ